MAAFQIVRQISSGKKGGEGKVVQTLQAIVNFGTEDRPELTTRHLIKEFTPARTYYWTGWNSDRTLRIRAGILEARETHKTLAESAEARVKAITKELEDLKGKRDVTEDRKRLRKALKSAKATSSVTKADLARINKIADKVDETHPEIVEFE